MKNVGFIKRIVCLLSLAACLFINVNAAQLSTDAYQDDVPDINFVPEQSHGIDATTTMLGSDRLVKNAQAVTMFESNSGMLLYTWKADAKMYPASLVKILTAYIALEEGNLNDTVTVSDDAVASVPLGAVSADLLAGEEMSLEALIYCMMVGSANDAAAVIAEHVGGSQTAFVEKMNVYAQSLGCVNTQFTNSHGLHDPEQFTTARDMTRILSAAIENDNFLKIFTAKEYVVDATNKSDIRSLATGNSMVDPTSKLYYDARVLGGRTGVTEDGKRCLATVAEHNGMRLICIVMGAESEYQEDGYSAIRVGGYKETSELLDAGSSGFKTAQIIYKDQALCQRIVTNGECDVVIGPNTSVVSILPENVSLNELVFHYTDLPIQAPIKQGDKVSSVQVWSGNVCVAQADLYALNSVRPAEALHVSEESDNSNVTVKKVLIILLCAVVGIFVILFVARGVQKIRRIAAANRKNRYHRNHRRSR